MANSNDDRILELAGKATPRPWAVEPHHVVRPIPNSSGREIVLTIPLNKNCTENTRYFVAAANCAPDFVRRIAALRASLDFYRRKESWQDDSVDIGVGEERIPGSSEACHDEGRTAEMALTEDDVLCAAMKVGDD